jgi:hypothetical protein
LHPAAGNDTVPKSPVPLLNRIDIKGERGEFSTVYFEGGNQLKWKYIAKILKTGDASGWLKPIMERLRIRKIWK